jgi:hypothetical protein
MERSKHTLFKSSSWTRFTRDGITEYSCTAESGSVEKEQTMQDWQVWTRNTWQSRLIRIRLLDNALTQPPRQAKDLSVQHVSHKQDRAESSQSKLGNKSVTWIKHKSQIQSNTW